MRRPKPRAQFRASLPDLLTGTEWNAAQVQELFRLATDVKAHPDRYKTRSVRPVSGDDF